MYLKLLAAVLLLASCAAAPSEFSAFANSTPTLDDLATQTYYPNNQQLVSAKTHFAERNYGKSYSFFKQAIEVAPTDPAAWLGFAASADMLRRFDQADVAYRKLHPVIGHRVEYLNNYGYSQLLRGNLTVARSYFLKAYEIAPSNPITANNL